MISSPVAMTFDASTHPNSKDRIAAWRDAFSVTVDVLFDDGEADGFAASIRYHPLGSVLLVERRYTSHTVVRSRETIARTGSEHLIFHYFLEGGLAGLVGGRKLNVRAGDCFVYDMRGTLHIHMLASHFIGLIIPRRLFGAAAERSGNLHGLILPAGSAAAEFLGAMVIGLAEQAERLSAMPQTFGTALIGIVAASIEGAHEALSTTRHSSQPKLVGANSQATATSTRLLRHIDRYAADPALNPKVLALAFRVSRATLYRVFGSEGGVAEAIRRRRVALAVSAMETSKNKPMSLALIARTSGFQNEAAMRRALHAVYGASPATLRRQAVKSESKAGQSSLAIAALFDDLLS